MRAPRATQQVLYKQNFTHHIIKLYIDINVPMRANTSLGRAPPLPLVSCRLPVPGGAVQLGEQVWVTMGPQDGCGWQSNV